MRRAAERARKRSEEEARRGEQVRRETITVSGRGYGSLGAVCV